MFVSPTKYGRVSKNLSSPESLFHACQFSGKPTRVILIRRCLWLLRKKPKRKPKRKRSKFRSGEVVAVI